MTRTGRRPAAAVAAVTAVLLAGCSASQGTPVAVPTQSAPVPGALAGVWHTRFEGADQKLALSGTSYEVYTDPADKAVGVVSVRGSQLTFSGSNTCQGSGTYRWSVLRSTLRLTLVGSDPCPRSGLLPGRSWSRVA